MKKVRKWLVEIVFGIVPVMFIVSTSWTAMRAGDTPPIVAWFSGSLRHWGPKAAPVVDQAGAAANRAASGAGNALTTVNPSGFHLPNGMGPLLLVVLGVGGVLLFQNVSSKGKGPGRKSRSR